MTSLGEIGSWTGDTAAIFSIEGRGVLCDGIYTDINVIDRDNLAMEVPEYKHDFPAGAGRFPATRRDDEQVIVNGQVFMEHGEHTGALAGSNVAQLTNLALGNSRFHRTRPACTGS